MFLQVSQNIGRSLTCSFIVDGGFCHSEENHKEMYREPSSVKGPFLGIYFSCFSSLLALRMAPRMDPQTMPGPTSIIIVLHTDFLTNSHNYNPSRSNSINVPTTVLLCLHEPLLQADSPAYPLHSFSVHRPLSSSSWVKVKEAFKDPYFQ